ncbi:hypothetical protein [Mangrovimonas sp. YM274]|uniref:hypothetical protein n=1 Tax=Mangrovimonas sp. YM274 TaxID=3070660 RepID=UPI0027DD479C|nr:hypothetical protein [Mangrovimonas sp. YM274]WMI67466.1 hypothetical protein RBH95_09945 [Mangrovimonas sp. YM274]
MKKLLLLMALVLACPFAKAQDFSKLNNYEFKTAESYQPQEDNVLLCANYLFNNPANQNEMNRKISIQFITKWMTGTPNYDFVLDENVLELTKGNDALFGLYMAAMTKVVLEHKGTTLSPDQVYQQVENILVDYCANEENNMKPSKKIKKLIKNGKR